MSAALDRRSSLIAGISLLVMSVLAGFANFVAIEAFVTPGDAARTAADIAGSAQLFRFGILLMLVVVALDVVVALALHRVFHVVHEAASRLQAALRLVYAAVFMVGISHLSGAARQATAADAASGPEADQSATQAMVAVDAFADAWDASLLLFGLHLLVLGWLLHRSGRAPHLLAPLVALAGVGYAVDSVVAVLSGDTAPVLSQFTFVGEFLLAVWLVARAGRRTTTALTTVGDAPASLPLDAAETFPTLQESP